MPFTHDMFFHRFLELFAAGPVFECQRGVQGEDPIVEPMITI